MNTITKLLETMFGIDGRRVELTDDLRADWGIDRRERRRFEEEFIKSFPHCACAPLRHCVTVGDFVRIAT
jgi:hypothetical protein